MAVRLIQDGQTIEDTIQPTGGDPLRFSFRPPLATELAEHRGKYSQKSEAVDREKVRLAFIASRMASWDVEGNPPITAETLARLPAAYLDDIENRVFGYVIKRLDDEKKS